MKLILFFHRGLKGKIDGRKPAPLLLFFPAFFNPFHRRPAIPYNKVAVPTKLYLWDKWFARRRFSLRRGYDYFCTQSSMSQQIRNAASARGLAVGIVETDDGLTVLVSGAAEGMRA